MNRFSFLRSLLLALPFGLVALATQAQAQNLVVNGSFEDPVVASGAIQVQGNILGWTKVTGWCIEVGRASTYGVSGADGLNVCELDGHLPDQHTRITQTIPVVPNRTYNLTFGIARRISTTESSNRIHLYVNGTLTVMYPGSTVMETRSISVVSPEPNLQIEFENGGSFDNLGSIIDNVSLVATEPFNVCPLYDPLKQHKSGSTIPIKLQLCFDGVNMSSPDLVLHSISVVQVGPSGPGILEDSGNANPDFDFRFDDLLGDGGGYIFNLSTKGLGSGTYLLLFQVEGESLVYETAFVIR